LNVPPGQASRDESWPGANEAKQQKLRRNTLQRRARAQGLELRHSEYGYALLDLAHKRVDDRNDMTLAEVETCLARG
jgi:predicted ATPase